MIVVVFDKSPRRLRGYLSRYLLEVSPTTFVGRVTKAVQKVITEDIERHIGNGSAYLVSSAKNEQGFEVLPFGNAHRLDYFDGLALFRMTNRKD